MNDDLTRPRLVWAVLLCWGSVLGICSYLLIWGV